MKLGEGYLFVDGVEGDIELDPAENRRSQTCQVDFLQTNLVRTAKH